MKKIIMEIKKIKWLNRWAGSYTLISCSYWGVQYCDSLKKQLGVNFNHTLFIHRKGTASFYVADDEFRKLGLYLAKKSEKNNNFAKKLCDGLKKNTDILIPQFNKFKKRLPTLSEYQKFLEAFDRHIGFHVFVKKAIDFLSAEGLEKLLPHFEDSRIYSEKVYSESEVFFRSLMDIISKKENYNKNYLTCLTQDEFESYLKSKELPSQVKLKERYIASALYFEKGKQYIITGKKVAEIEKIISAQAKVKTNEIKGISAYPGKVSGVARIVPDPFSVKKFNKGDVLITGMTRPEFMLLIHKASAIVTDAGGVLCHAAITAREFKIPCIVGTAIATKVLKNGDLVEVDANQGMIRIVNKK